MNTAHKAELLYCGCRVIPATGETVTTCARHTCSPVVRHVELPTDPSGQGLRPLCPECASPHIRPVSDYLVCDECKTEFSAEEIVGFGLSVDSKPRQCPHCNTITYGQCTCWQGATNA